MKKLFIVLVGSLFCCMSCGSDDCPTCPRPPAASGSPPQITILACDPDSAPAEGPGSILMDCSLFFRDEDGDLETIVFSHIQGCEQDPGPVSIDVSGQAGVSKEGNILLEDLIVRTTCSAGIYTYGFTAVDSKENESLVETLEFELL